jgi:hypothetical protein
LNVIDDFNQDVLWIEVGTSLPAERVVRVLEQLLDWRGKPANICMDNGPELISQRLESWAQDKHIHLLHIQPGKPAQNAYIERFNSSYREDVLDAYLFDDLEEVGNITNHWLEDYNTIRPHEALQGVSPRQFARQHASICLLMIGTLFGTLTALFLFQMFVIIPDGYILWQNATQPTTNRYIIQRCLRRYSTQISLNQFGKGCIILGSVELDIFQ